jgi:hypothetical protein
MNFELEKKLLNKICYKQGIIKNDCFLNLNYTCIVDNYETHFINYTKKKLGETVNTNTKVFLERKIKESEFILENTIFFLKDYAYSFNILKNLHLIKNTKFTLIIIKSVRGGYIAFSNGIVGFLPSTQIVSFLNKKKSKININKKPEHKQNKYSKITLLFQAFFYTNETETKMSLIRIPFVALSCYFSFLNKKRQMKSKLNFIFILSKTVKN